MCLQKRVDIIIILISDSHLIAFESVDVIYDMIQDPDLLKRREIVVQFLLDLLYHHNYLKTDTSPIRLWIHIFRKHEIRFKEVILAFVVPRVQPIHKTVSFNSAD